jgi:GntR family transcriptional regulator, galactonate operon transcriptional repressor
MSVTKMTRFQPKNLNAQVVDLLGQRIVEGYYREGEQLPIEADLCTEFGVSRPIVREATKILISKGLLSSRPKIGTVVKIRHDWNLLDSDVLTWITQALPPAKFLDMLFETRMAIEPCAAELAAQKASDAQIEQIKSAYDAMASAKTVEDSIEPDLRFHQAIMDASHNEVIRYIGHTLHNALAVSFSLTSWNKKVFEQSLARHFAIYSAIAKRNIKGAGEATRKLLLDSRKDFDSRPRY